MIGKTVSHYRIIEKLGEGGMGVVYRAEDVNLGRMTALKFLAPKTLGSGDDRKRFVREARSAASLNHPNISTVYGIEEHEGEPFIAMELVDGRDLSETISGGPLKVGEAIRIAIQAAEGLGHAHDEGVVHRDIKPGNIMVTAGGRAKIMDFGLAGVADRTRLTREGTTLGTVAYMSPEQARGEDVDRRADIWALGAVLYEMLTGRRPFEGEYDQAVVYRIMNEDPEPPTALRSGLPMELERIVLKALEKRPDERYQHADDLVSDLRRLERRLETGSVPSQPSAPTPSPGATRPAGPPSEAARPAEPTSRRPAPSAAPRRRTWLIAAAALIAVLIAGYMLLRPVILDRQLVAAPKPIAVIPFENMTGDPEYDYLRRAIPNLLITSLEQSKYLRVTTWERMRDLLDQTGRGDVDLIDKEVGFELSRIEGIDFIVTGSFVKAGNTFVTDVKVLDVETKELVRSASARGEGVESILKSQVDELSGRIAEGVGLSARKVEDQQKPVAEVTTGSMEAYNFYLRGVEESEKFYHEDARRFLERAVEIDSTFAIAWMHLGRVYGFLMNFQSREQAFRKAMRHSENATERERLYIRAKYADVIEKDDEKYGKLLEELVRKYPREKRAWLWLGQEVWNSESPERGSEYIRKSLSLDFSYAPALNQMAYFYKEMEDYGAALEYLERYAAASPGDANPFDSMGELYFQTGELEKAAARFRDAVEVRPDFYNSMYKIAYVYGVMGDLDSALVWLDRYLETAPNAELRLYGLGWRSLIYLRTGRIEEALADLRTWERLLEFGSQFQTTAHKFILGHCLLAAGRHDEAIETFREWLDRVNALGLGDPFLARSWNLYATALVHARTGDADEAMEKVALARELSSRSGAVFMEEAIDPLNTVVWAECLLAAGRLEESVAVMTDSLELHLPRMSAQTRLLIHNYPLEIDVAARALLAMGELEKAAGEYLYLLEFHPETEARRMKNPVYHYRLAKVYEQMGRTEDAIEHYTRFLEYWRNADPGRPEYIDAGDSLDRLTAG